MVSAVEFAGMSALIANYNDAVAVIQDLKNDNQYLARLVDLRQNLIDELERQKAELQAELDSARGISSVVTNVLDGEARKIRHLEATISQLRQQEAASAEEIRNLRDRSLNFALGAVFAKADAAGTRAMLDIVRRSPPDFDPEQPHPGVPAPEGHEDSPLQSAYRVAYAQHVAKYDLKREAVDHFEAAMGKLPFPVMDYVEWLAKPDTTLVDVVPPRRKPRAFGTGGTMAELVASRIEQMRGTPHDDAARPEADHAPVPR